MSDITLTQLIVSSPSLGFPDWQLLGLYAHPEHAVQDSKTWYDRRAAEIGEEFLMASYEEATAFVGVPVKDPSAKTAIVCATVISIRELFPSYQFNRIFATKEEAAAFADKWYKDACKDLGLSFDGEDWLNTSGEVADILSKQLAVRYNEVPILESTQF